MEALTVSELAELHNEARDLCRHPEHVHTVIVALGDEDYLALRRFASASRVYRLSLAARALIKRGVS